MPFIGAVPAQKYISLAKQDFTTIAGTGYTLDQSVTNEVDIALFINHVRQEPTTAYTASGTTLTLTSATTTSDDMYCVFLAKATETVNPPSGSVGTDQLEASAVTTAKIADSAVTYAKSTGFGKVGQVVTATVDSSQTTSSTSFVAATNFELDITPSSTSSKVLILVSGAQGAAASQSTDVTVYRDDTTNLGTAVGLATGGLGTASQINFSVLDTPSTTSSTNYQVYFKVTGGTNTINYRGVRGTITAMEILG
jgi:hypothetical protein